MKLKDILAIGGKPGLYRFVAQSKNGIIVESIQDKKRFPAYATDKVSALDDIAVFTETDEVSLSKLMDKIYEKHEGGKTINPKSQGGELKTYFEELLPDYDRERVYTSDMKKILTWYNFLHAHDMLIPGEDKESDNDPSNEGNEAPSNEDDAKTRGKEEN